MRDLRPYRTSEPQPMGAKLKSGKKTSSGRGFLPLLKTSRDDLVSQDEMLSFPAACWCLQRGSNELQINLQSTANSLWHEPLLQLINCRCRAKIHRFAAWTVYE